MDDKTYFINDKGIAEVFKGNWSKSQEEAKKETLKSLEKLDLVLTEDGYNMFVDKKKRYDACYKELKELFTLYENIYMRDDGNYDEDNTAYEIFEDSKNTQFVIFTEFIPKDEDEVSRVKIHYEINYWGTSDFNEVLNKYNMSFDWYDSCIAVIYDETLKNT
jgi:hypothetical protein